jgi:hypothetical protein
VRGTPSPSPTVRLNARFRRKITVLMAHDHMDVGTDMSCNMAEAHHGVPAKGVLLCRVCGAHTGHRIACLHRAVCTCVVRQTPQNEVGVELDGYLKDKGWSDMLCVYVCDL